jgi:hypothetical protein
VLAERSGRRGKGNAKVVAQDPGAPSGGETLRVQTAETMNSGRATADGVPLSRPDDAQLRTNTIDALRQRIESLTLRISADASSSAGAGLNAAYADDLRAARIFALQLNKLGVNRLLDIGSGGGRFGLQIRRFGFKGLIYSVEPRWPRYLQLLLVASTDPQWIPLARQGASDVGGVIDLPLVSDDGPGFQSPLGIPTPAEHVEAARAVDLLNPSAMSQVDALRINANGMERPILEGLGPVLSTLSLVMLHGTAVGKSPGTGFFALDAALVNSYGFSRVALEPASYDDDAGAVRQYHGIYARPGRHDAPAGGVEVGGVVTSIGGPMQRIRFDGADVGPWWANLCINSWVFVGGNALSVSEAPSPSDAVTWSQCATKPPISELFRRMQDIGGTHVLLTNADVCLTEKMKGTLPTLAPGVMYYGNRHEVQLNPDNSGGLVTAGYFAGGFDYFLLPREFVQVVNELHLIPDAFLVGEPWWDYVVPVLALATGFPCKKLPANTMYALHYSHSERSTKEQWRQNGQLFDQYVRGIYQNKSSYAREVLAHILRQPEADFDDRLAHMSQIVCYGLP